MTPEAARRAAKLLIEARREVRPLDALPADCRPAGADDGYQVQACFVAASGEAAVGYKIGATSQRAQTFLGCDGPFAGTVLAKDLLESPLTLPAGRFIFRLIEPEFAFRLARDLPPREAPYGEAELAEAVASLHPAIEVVTCALSDWRHQDVGALIADNGVNGALVLGPGCTDWRRFDLPSHPVTLAVNGVAAGPGVGANALGGPLTALAWLADHQPAGGLKAGHVVTTGVVTEFVELDAGDEAVADYGDLGQVRVRFEA